jgi:polycystin 2
MIEFPSSGGIVTSSTFHNVKLLRYVDSFDYFIMACEILCIIFLLAYSANTIFKVKIFIKVIFD